MPVAGIGETRRLETVIRLRAVLLTGEEFETQVLSDSELDAAHGPAESRIGNLREIHDSTRSRLQPAS